MKQTKKTHTRYFDEDEDGNGPDLAYIPAPGSPSANKVAVCIIIKYFVRLCLISTFEFDKYFIYQDDSDDEDPLDAYMMGIEKHLEKENTKTTSAIQSNPEVKVIKGTRGDIDDEDDEESYYR